MSYSRTYNETVSKLETVNVRYEASQHGGTKTVTLPVTIPVSITIHVDTDQFENSVGHCSGGMQGLTATVAATNAAQAAAIAEGSQKISKSIINGFVKLIQSELTQQIAEKKARCDALLLKLNDMKAGRLSRKTQMEKDFTRIADRYTTLFHDLDRELANRIKTLDRGAFAVSAVNIAHDDRWLSGSLSIVPTLVSGEENRARTGLGVCGLRKSAMGLLGRAGAYLAADRKFGQTLESILTTDQQNAEVRLAPIMMMELLEGSAPQECVYPQRAALANLARAAAQQSVRGGFGGEEVEWVPMDDQRRTQIEGFLAKQLTEGVKRNERVDAMIMRLWQADRPLVARRRTGRR